MVSPAPLQSARLESLLINKPKTPAASSRNPTGFITKSSWHFCFQEAQARTQFNFREMLCLATHEGSEAINKKQRKDRLYLLEMMDSKWLFSTCENHHPQSPKCITLQSINSYKQNKLWVIFCTSLSIVKTFSRKSHDRKNKVLCYKFSYLGSQMLCASF